MMPFDYNLKHSTCKERHLWRRELTDIWREYGKNIDSKYTDFPMPSSMRKYVVWLLQHKMVAIAIWQYMVWRKIHMKEPIKRNFCAN